MFGIWKRSFPVLILGIRSRLPLAQRIIVACAVLHNISCQEKEENFEDDEQDDDGDYDQYTLWR